MEKEFLLERRLKAESPELSARFRNVILVTNAMLEKIEPLFPNFTDHSLRHVTFVTQFANTLVGIENIDRMNIDEIYILLMACALHDIGMTIGNREFDKYSPYVVPDNYFDNPANTIRSAVRNYHQDFSACLVKKFADLFEIPDEDYVYCIAQTVRGHRKVDLFDENNFNPSFKLQNGNTVCLSYLSAILRLADELDIAKDRNAMGSYEEHSDIMSFRQHFAIKHMEICNSRIELEVDTHDDEIYASVEAAINKLKDTMLYSRRLILEKTDYSFKWDEVIVKQDFNKPTRAIVLDTDAGTDDAMAMALISRMGELTPTYIVASPGNTSIDNAIANIAVLRKKFGFTARIVRGMETEDIVNRTYKNTFHGTDGFADIGKEMISESGLSAKELTEDLTFTDLMHELEKADEILYITIGPLSTLAEIITDNCLKKKINHIFVMGGGFNEFNCPNYTEFNFSKSPKAVSKILSSDIPLTIFPLDLTNRQTIDEKQIEKWEAKGADKNMLRLLRFNLASNTFYNHINAAVIHDAMPILFLSYQNKFEIVSEKILSDEYGRTYKAKNGRTVFIANNVENELLLRELESALLQVDKC